MASPASVWDDVFGDGAPVVTPSAEEVHRAARRSADATKAAALFPFTDSLGAGITAPLLQPLPVLPTKLPSDLVWPEHAPLFWGQVSLVKMDHVGGGRGLAATRDVHPGEILLVESPLVRWSSASRRPQELLAQVLRGPDALVCLKAMRKLHPEKLESVRGLASLRKDFRGCLQALLPVYCALLNDPSACVDIRSRYGDKERCGGHTDSSSGGPSAETSHLVSQARARSAAMEELLRLCLVCRWNAFSAGLFLHQALINHASPATANCDKAWHAHWGVRKAALPAAQSATQRAPRDGAEAWDLPSLRRSSAAQEAANGVSVVRATRFIRAGEEITISYLHPFEISAARAAMGLRQFDFSCNPPFDAEMHALPHGPSCDSVCDAQGGISKNASEDDGDAAQQASTAAMGRERNGEGGAEGCEAERAFSSAGIEVAAAMEDEAEATLRCAIESAASAASLLHMSHAVNAALGAACDVWGSRHLVVATLRRTAAAELRARLSESLHSEGSALAPPRGNEAGDAAVPSSVNNLDDGRSGKKIKAAPSTNGQPDAGSSECEAGVIGALLELLQCSLELWYTRRRLLGPLHPECALALHDIGACLNRLLASGPFGRRALAAAFPQWAEPRAAAMAEARAFELHTAISALYITNHIC